MLLPRAFWCAFWLLPRPSAFVICFMSLACLASCSLCLVSCVFCLVSHLVFVSSSIALITNFPFSLPLSLCFGFVFEFVLDIAFPIKCAYLFWGSEFEFVWNILY